MNRKFIVVLVVIIAAGLGSHFYVKWDMARFDASLPTLPTEEQQVSDDTADDTAGGTTGGHWHGDEWHAEPHVDEAPPVQPVTEPAAGVTEDTEATLKLPPIPPSELSLELDAIQADFKALRERRGTLSPAEFQKGQDDIMRRQHAWHDKFDKQAEETAAFIREREAERQEAVGDR